MKLPLLLVACATETAASLVTDLAVSGYRVRFAASGMELLKIARRLRPDLIVLDPHLPDLANVCENLDRIPWTSTIPRILLTERRRNSAEAIPTVGTSSGLLGSSLDLEELMRQVEEILGVAPSPPTEWVAPWLGGERRGSESWRS
jgi:CheY-like chemotaxis protein